MKRNTMKKWYLSYSFREPKKYYIIIMLVTLISVIFLGIVYAFYQALITVNYSKNVYGHQHITAYGATKDQLQLILSDENVESAVSFYHTEFKECIDSAYDETIQQPIEITSTYVFEQIPSNYFDLTEYELTAGRMPESETEILCTSGYLTQYGLQYNDMLGSEISILEKHYTVVGLYTVNRLYFNFEETVYRFFTGAPSVCNAVALKFKDSDTAQFMLQQPPFIELKCDWNENLSVMQANINGIKRDCYYVFIIIIVTVLTIITHCMKMLLDQHKKNIGIYRLIGISTIKLTVSVFCRICYVLLPLLPFIQGCLFFAVKGVISFYNRLFTNKIYNDEFNTVQVETTVLIPVVMMVLYLGIGLLVSFIQVRTSGLNSIRYGHRLKWKTKGNRAEVTPHAVAKRHLKIAKAAGILTTGCICFACVSFTLTNIAFARRVGKQTFYQKYDYYAELDNNMLLCNSQTTIEQTMDAVTALHLDGVVAEPYYYSILKISVPKFCANLDYINILAQTSGDADKLLDPYRKNIEVPVYVCGFTDAMWEQVTSAMGGEQYSLQDDCATAFQYLVNQNSDIPTLDFERVTTLDRVDQSLDPYQVSINKVETRFPLEVVFPESALVVAVNIPTFQRLTGLLVPRCIGYYVEKAQSDVFTSLFAGCNFINLINVNESECYQRCQQAEENMRNISFVFMILFAFSVLHMITTLRMRYHSHEYTIMYILGIPHSKIAKMIRLEILYTLLPSIVLSNIITALAILIDNMTHVDKYSPAILFISIGAFNLILIMIAIWLMITAQQIVDKKE